MYFDRRISERLLSELESGIFSWLPVVCRESVRLDLQLRGDPRAGESRATAYVGTTKVLDVYERQNQFRVVASKSAQGWSDVPLPWSTLRRFQPLELIEPYSNDLARHTAKAAAAVPNRWAGNEGLLQTFFARQMFRDVVVIDREAVVGFSSVQERKQVHAELLLLFAGVLTRMRERWGEPNARESWTKADFLGLDTDGRLLVIEVKRGDDPRLGWTPAQVAYYAALFDLWPSESGSVAIEIIESMLVQRRRLGIIPPQQPRVATPVEVVPVVAVGTPISQFSLERVREMGDELAADGQLACGAIAIWIVDPVAMSLTVDGGI
jgi:hypothetical protein